MFIERVECEQFAGIVDKDLSFDRGLNLVIGNNESGKSTIADLIFQMLFKDSKIDKRIDSDFIDKYFPKKVSGPEGDVIDGVLVFNTSEGRYKLKKEWEKGEGSCRLTLPDGTVIRDIATINEIISRELSHRSGVYSEIVFASQKRNQIAVESIMKTLSRKADSLSSTRDDLKSVLNQASLETGGVSLDKLEKKLKEKTDSLIGHWDIVADAPEGGAKRASYSVNPWKMGVGDILKAYYEMDEVRDIQNKAEQAERVVETKKGYISGLKTRKRQAEAQKEIFQKYRSLLGQINLLNKAISEKNSIIEQQAMVLKKWPELDNKILKAKSLKKMLRMAEVKELYESANAARASYLEKVKEFEKLKEVDKADTTQLRTLITRKQKAEGRLAGLNLVAKIKQLSEKAVEVKSSRTGQVINGDAGEYAITESVDICVPGVVEIQLMPQGVDVDTIKSEIDACNNAIKEIFEKYGVKTEEELINLSDKYTEVKQLVENAKLLFEKRLGKYTWEEVKSFYDEIASELEKLEKLEKSEEISDKTQILSQIEELCESKSIDAFIGGLEQTKIDFQEKYKDIANLESLLAENKTEVGKLRKQLEDMDEIPEVYKSIADPESYNNSLQLKIDDYDKELEKSTTELIEAEKQLKDKSAEEYSDELQKKQDVLQSLKDTYRHWKNISDKFTELKNQTSNNPTQDIEEKFREYLGVITGGTLTVNSMDEDIEVKLASGNKKLTFDNLSEGTRDTISLAFRLAMLEHLYPEGDGLAIFDDPFTDMDPTRVQQSCRLIEKFAENNQVIFITCDDKYKALMDAKVINM